MLSNNFSFLPSTYRLKSFLDKTFSKASLGMVTTLFFILFVFLGVLPVDALSAVVNSKKPVLPIQHWTTTNGARVYYVNAKELPIVDIRVAFDAGSDRDSGRPGLASLTSSMLDEGTKNLSADQIAAGFEKLGAIFSANTSKDTTIVSLRSLIKPELLKPALDLYTKTLTRAKFPDAAFKRVQKNTLNAIKAQQQSPGAIAAQAFFKALYGDGPYGHPVAGNEKSVAGLKPSDLTQFFKNYYVAKNAVIAIVGAVNIKQAKKIAEQITQDMPKGSPAITLASLKTITGKRVSIQYPSSQTTIYLGTLGISPQAKDYFPLIVGNHILGGSVLVSRLFKEVREKQGLSYGIYSAFTPLAYKGPFTISLQTRNGKTQQALNVTKQLLQTFVNEGPTQQELIAAKRNLIGGFPLRYASNSHIAGYLIFIGFYHLPLNYLDAFRAKINAVKIGQIKRAFQKTINPKQLITVVVGGKS